MSADPSGRYVRGVWRPWQPPAPSRYCLAICYCGTCPHYRPTPVATVKPAKTTRTLLDKEAWRLRFIDHIKALPVGTEFTTADLHGKIPDPSHHSQWGSAQRHAADLGLIHVVTTQKSELGTTKASLVRRWVRIDEQRRVA